jgi:precorrin-6B methylase 2
MPDKPWTVDQISQISRSFQGACVLGAAADLDLFTALAGQPFTAADAANKLPADLRAITILLDALAALQLLDKHADGYRVPPTVADMLSSQEPGNQLAMAQHQANCLRRWAQLGAVVKTGRVVARQPSIRGADADYASFIEAMDNVSGPVAATLVADLQPLHFRHLLDVGGGSGTWTIAFLMANPSARATLFDLPPVMPQARDRIAKANLTGRVTLTPGDFYTDRLPAGADLALVSAIVHQNSREQNRQLFARVFEALASHGQILIRDILMDSSRTTPIAGALFAVNMLVGTDSGGTYTFDELRDDLAAVGFTSPKILRHDEGMQSVLAATKP